MFLAGTARDSSMIGFTFYICIFFIALVVVRANKDRYFFKETFDEVPDIFAEKWTKSLDPKYANQPVMIKHADKAPPGYGRDKGLSLTQEMKFYGVSSKFPTPLDNVDGGDIVLQYELKLEESLICGGAYIKMPRVDGGGDLQYLNSDTPYSIMFGPDKCGDDNDRVHFILQHYNPVSHTWEEKHFKDPPNIAKDTFSHLYTLAIYGKTNTFEIFIDKESIKPADWVDNPTIPDPQAVKPADWVDPTFIPDPDAEKPEDWDEEEDGEWESPQVPNPLCTDIVSGCGHYNPRKIPNPDYIGPWKPPEIENPAYSYANPAIVAPMSGIALELWTTNAGVHFDNFLITRQLDTAFEYADSTFVKKSEREHQQKQWHQKVEKKSRDPEDEEEEEEEEEDEVKVKLAEINSEIRQALESLQDNMPSDIDDDDNDDDNKPTQKKNGPNSSAEFNSSVNSFSDDDDKIKGDEPLTAEDERIEGILRKRILTMLSDELDKQVVDANQSK
eukprot:GSChrysophyteH1.ASY1.ANO1.942.1 assembled CDS